MTREEIDALYSRDSQNITRADIDKLYNIKTQETSVGGKVSSPKVKKAPDNTAENNRRLAAMDPKVRDTIYARRAAAARGTTVWEENAPAREAAMIKEKSRRGLSVVEQNDMRKAEEASKYAVRNQVVGQMNAKKIPVLDSIDASAKAAGQFMASKQRDALQQKVDSERNPMLKNRYQKELDELVRNQNQIVLSDNSTQEDVEAAMNQWLNTGYKMTDDEKKSAQEYITRYEATAKNPIVYKLTDAEQAELDRVNNLRDKIHGSEALAYGIMSAMPFVDIGMRKADKDGEYANALANAKTQNPTAYYGGEIASNLAQYAVGSKLMQSIPQVASATGKAGQAIGKATEKGLGVLGVKGAEEAGKAVGSGATNVLGDMILDTSLDTLPNALQDAQSGLSSSEVAGNAAKNFGTNLGWNVLGEGAGNLIPYLGEKVGKLSKKMDEAVTSSVGLQLPNVKSQADPIFDYSIPDASLNTTKKEAYQVPDAIIPRRTSEIEPKLTSSINSIPNSSKNVNSITEPKKVGKNTLIYEEYQGEVPKQSVTPSERVVITPESYSNATNNMNSAVKVSAETGTNQRSVLKKIYEGMFKNGETQFSVPVKNTTFGDKSYIVTVNKNAIGKIMSGKDLSVEKIAVLEGIEEVIENSKFVGSGNYANYKGKANPKQIDRYDYFETDINLNGEDYVVAFSVEVVPGKNNYRTHKVINEINLAKDVPSGETGYLPAARGNQPSLFNDSIPNSSKNVNSIADDTGFRNPELTTDARTLNSGSGVTGVGQTITPEVRARSYTNETIQKTDMPEEIKNEFREDPRTYEVLKNSDTQAQADAILANNNFNGAYAQFNTLLSKKDPTAIPLGYSLAKQLAESGNTEQAIDIIDRMSEQLTKAGQFSQAAAITMLQNEPMSAMRYMEKQLDKMNATGRGKYKNWQDFELTEDEIKAFANIDKGDSEAIQELYGQITDRLAKSYPSTKWEKVVEASKTAMMLNPRTHIRNVAANAVMLPVRSLTDRVSALGQNAIHLFNSDFEVTQSLIGGTRAQKKIADQIFDDQILPLLKDTAKWNDVTKNAPRNRQVFNDSVVGKVGKKAAMWPLKIANVVAGGRLDNLINKVDKSMTNSVMENLRKFDYWLLGEVEDNVFVKENFSNRLASYMKAQRISSIDEVPNEAVQIAYQEALKATFKDDNTLTRMFSNVKRDTGKFGEVMLPFTKTPANIAMRGIDYSPAGVINAIKQAGKKVDGKNVFTGAQIVDTLAKSATGTAGIALGYLLAKEGIVQGALSKDADAQQFEKQQGKVAFSLKIGDNYYSFDWAQPAAIPIIIGSTIFDALEASDKENGSVLNSIVQGAMAATDAWADLSPLSSLQDIFGGSGYGDNSIAENVFGEIAEFPQRLMPAVMGATARTIDPTMRQTYSKGNMLQTQIDTIKSKIPFLSETLPASYDTWGNERKRQGSTASAAIANFVNPGTLGYDASTPLDGEIERLYEATQSNIVFPRKAGWSVKDGEGNTINLDNKQYSEYQKAMGQTSYDIADTLINSEFYESLSDGDKAEYLSEIYSVANSKAKHDLFGTPVADTLAKKVALYEEEGAEGLIREMQIKHDITANGLTVSEKTRQIYEDGGIPYLETYNEIRSEADKDGNGGLKKDELIPYLDGSGMSTTEKRYWFGMLSTAKNPY